MPEDPQKDPIEALIQNVLKELQAAGLAQKPAQDRKSTRLNSSHRT